MRNDIAHGSLSDKQFRSSHALYTWWFILKICYMFCGELQGKNRIKVNDKLRKLFEGKRISAERTLPGNGRPHLRAVYFERDIIFS